MQPTSPPPQPLEPRERLDPNAKRIWIIGDLIGTVVLTTIALGLTLLVRWLADLHWVWTVVPVAMVLGLGLAWTLTTPRIRYNQWRYAIRDDEVDLAHGIVVKTRQIVPMARIQHVDTTRGPIQRRYGLASVVFYTAAGAMTIPELADERAAEVRDRIAALAKVSDELL
ncbi:MAG TPA: PH domain-containing protein [Thermomicrobiales bacterium]|nr:PH domain-containing protein [Thermomicrobiales bacterium]